MLDPVSSPRLTAGAAAGRWRAVLARDPAADGRFVFAVRSTGIYCRPSCPARRPRRDQVSFYGGPAEAERAGYRACRRCHPREDSMHDQQATLIRQACDFIERAPDAPPSLAALGRHIGYSPYHLHRMFRRFTGVTPRQYAEAVRGRRLRGGLGAGAPVTDAMLAKAGADDWLMRRGNFANWGFSTLDQINTGNVGGLRLAWAWNMELGYQEEAPLAHEGVLFLAQPRNVVQALDGRTGDLLWEYRRELPKVEGGYHNDLFSRARGTIALHDDKVFLATADAHIVASTRTLVK